MNGTDGARAALVAALDEVADIRGAAFQDEPWWPEAVALHKALRGKPWLGTLTENERADASYVLDWLRESGAPGNIVALQEKVVQAAGGYISVADRARPW